MNTASKKTAALDYWHSLYKPLQDGFFMSSAAEFSSKDIVVREMILDMEELNTKLASTSPDWVNLQIYADTLIVPQTAEDGGNFAFKLGGSPNQSVQIFARSIVLPDGSGLFINYDKSTQLTVYCQEISGGELRFSGLNGDPEAFSSIWLDPESTGFSISGASAGPVPAKPPAGDLVSAGSPAYWLLESVFNVGSGLAYSNNQLSANQFRWVAQIAELGSDDETQHLAINAANMQGFVSQLDRKIAYVPPLDQSIYKDVSSSYLGAVGTFENTFNQLVANIDQQQNAEAFVEANAQHASDEAKVAARLAAQFKQNVSDAEKVLKQNSTALNELTKHNGTVDTARIAFKAGVKKYKRQQEDKAIVAICESVIEVGVSIGAMVVGDEAAVATAAEGAAGIVKSAEVAAKTVSKIEKLMEAMKKIAKVLKKLGDLLVKLKAAKEAIEKMMKAVALKAGDFGKGILVPHDNNDDVFDNAYWEVFRLNNHDILGPYADETQGSKIDGASEYLKALDELAIYGQAVYANQLTLTQLNQKLLKQILDEQVSRNQVKRLGELADQQHSREEQLQYAKILTYQNLLRLKGKVVFYMEEQAAAFRYWAAEDQLPASLRPSLADSAGTLKAKLAKIEEGRADAMKKFDPSPQPLDVHIKIDDADAIKGFQKNGILSYTTPLDLRDYALFGRLRVERFRVYLNDEAITDPDKTIELVVSLSSHYIDRFKNGPLMQYTSTHFAKPFEYKSNDKSNPVADGSTADEFEYSYFQPTPFTTWTIKLKEGNPVDMSKLSHLTLRLTGTGVANVTAA